MTFWSEGRVVVASAIVVDVVVDAEAELVVVASIEPVVSGADSVVVDSPDPAELQAPKASSAAIATPI